jgi:hypothetical protein
MSRIPFYMEAYTAEDVEDFARELAAQMVQHDEETDPHWRDVLAEMREAVFPSLPFRLPVGLPAPRPVQEVGR